MKIVRIHLPSLLRKCSDSSDVDNVVVIFREIISLRMDSICVYFFRSASAATLCTHRISLPSDSRPWWMAPASSYNFSTEKPSDMTCHKRARYGSNTLRNLIKQQSENHHHLVNRLNWLVCLFTLVFQTAHTITTIYRRDMDRVQQKKLDDVVASETDWWLRKIC